MYPQLAHKWLFGHSLPMDKNDFLTRAAIFPDLFDSETCARAIEMARQFPPSEGRVGSGDTENPDIRRSQIWFFDPSPQTAFIFGPLNQAVKHINQGYRFQISGWGEGCQIARYSDSVRGHYDWHMDLGTDRFSRRKISLSVQLSDPASYEGGDLEFHIKGLDRAKMRKQGTLIAFPSYLEHRVAPVIRGERYSLVVWVDGPPYR